MIPLILFLLLSCTPKHYNPCDSETATIPELQSVWIEKPIVEICIQSNLSKKKVAKIVEYAVAIDPVYQPLDIRYANCVDEVDLTAGKIYFLPQDKAILDANGWDAYTRRLSTSTLGLDKGRGILFGASIHANSLNTNTILLHEYFHAWGWDHTLNHKHLMHHQASRCTTGLDQYQRLAKLKKEE